MKLQTKRVLVCNCEASMPLDARALGAALGTEPPVVHTQLCRAQIEAFRRAAASGEPLLVACTQEAPLFAETAPETAVSFTNIREHAGWSDEASAATPKIAALLAEAALDAAATPVVSLKSEGTTLVYGRDERAIEAAKQVAHRLDVTVLLLDPEDVMPPRVADVPIFKGRIVAAKGHLGAFEIVVDGYAAPSPASRERLVFGRGKDGAISQCDLILDLTGGAPLMPRRDGYLRADPGSPAAVQKALFDLVELVGEFEKPRYIDFSAELCAHSRSRKTGCTRCLEVCPTGAIAPDGDHVTIDPHVCAGCGNCASVCPTGAASYAFPPQATLFERLRTLLLAYRRAGGADPVLLVHDAREGDELIAAIARYEGGLPAHVVPFQVNETTQLGLDFFAAALAWGAARIAVLLGRNAERDGVDRQAALASAILASLGYGRERVVLLDEADPAALATRLREERSAAPEPSAFLPMGGKRSVTMLALRHLHERAPAPVELVPLPEGAPFGAVRLDVAGCTLCLSCVGACPTGALLDNPDKPQLSFQEDACIQCGLCRSTCPERVIALEPRLNFAAEARSAMILKEEEPATCPRCGKAFGTKSSIDRIVAKLAGKMDTERLRLCGDCRVVAQFEEPAPLAGKPRPRPRTSDDYLADPKG
ncbi:MAG: 4Fe-4S binding protein [Rhodospirillales bacterium]|nr:4Fe-4S binding protein [Rhodospirillales bacterium]